MQHGPIFCFWALKDSFEAVPLWESAWFGAIGKAHCSAAEVAEIQQGVTTCSVIALWGTSAAREGGGCGTGAEKLEK